MKITVLTDNRASESLTGEWGFSAYIEYQGKNLLLDTGASGLFAENAEKLGLSVQDVDAAILSHAHYDHAGGMERFFRENQKAKFYLQENCLENCYHKKWLIRVYIGIPRGITKKYEARIERVAGIYRVMDGVTLVGHSTPKLEEIGRRECMFQKTKNGWKPDDFSHEQSLVLEAEDGLVILNSCSHGGVVNIIREVREAFPNRKIKALIGGFHIFKRPEAEIRELAALIRETGIEALYTGHCSKERGYRILREELGDMVGIFRTGLVLEF